MVVGECWLYVSSILSFALYPIPTSSSLSHSLTLYVLISLTERGSMALYVLPLRSLTAIYQYFDVPLNPISSLPM
jgi:hypothetical protein